MGQLHRAIPKKFAIDTNIVHSFLDARNPSHQDVSDTIHKLTECGNEFYYFYPTLFEIQQYWRSRSLIECVDRRIDKGFYFYGKFIAAYRSLRPQLGSRDIRDHEFKSLRKTLENVAQGKGERFWLELCQEAFEGRFAALNADLANLAIRFADVGDAALFPAEAQADWPNPTGASALMEKYGLGSRDAAILHYTNCAHGVAGLITNDSDLHFAAKHGGLKHPRKIITIP